MEEDSGWPFDQPPDVAAITSIYVLDGSQPVRQVIHYSDDHSWAFTCGTTIELPNLKVVHMGHILEMDDTLRSIAHLEPGWSAYREGLGELWEIEPEEEEE
jgi:hypothetical protein